MPPTGRRFFTLDAANKMLPLIRHIVDEIAVAARQYERLQAKLESNKVPEADLPQVEGEYCDAADRLEDCLQELRNLGVEFKGWEGLVDFPGWVDGREIEYCWKQGEPEVAHWHELYAGYANRRPMPVTAPIMPEVILGEAAVEEYVPDDVTQPVVRKKAKSKVVRRSEG